MSEKNTIIKTRGVPEAADHSGMCLQGHSFCPSGLAKAYFI